MVFNRCLIPIFRHSSSLFHLLLDFLFHKVLDSTRADDATLTLMQLDHAECLALYKEYAQTARTVY